VQGGEEHGDRAGVEGGDARGALRSRRVEDGLHVLGPLLGGGDGPAGDAVGGAGAATVEQDDPAERGQPLDEVLEARHRLQDLDVAPEPEEEEEVDRPVADDLVGHIGIPDRDVPRGAQLLHRDMIARPGGRCRARTDESGETPVTSSDSR
jgi:hypothetical protein